MQHVSVAKLGDEQVSFTFVCCFESKEETVPLGPGTREKKYEISLWFRLVSVLQKPWIPIIATLHLVFTLSTFQKVRILNPSAIYLRASTRLKGPTNRTLIKFKSLSGEFHFYALVYVITSRTLGNRIKSTCLASSTVKYLLEVQGSHKDWKFTTGHKINA